MKKRPFSALLFVLLLVAIGLVGWRRVEGPPVPDGFAVLRQPNSLEQAIFRLDEPARVVVNATGSVGADGQLEAYPWLLDATTRKTVWRFTAGRARKAEGTLLEQRDTLRLPVGTYELYYTPYGRNGDDSNPAGRIFDRHQQWRNDRKQWYVSLRALDGGQPVRIYDRDAMPEPSDVVWRSGGDGPRENAEGIVEVTSPAVVHVQFTGARIGAGAGGRIERLSDATLLWEAQASQAQPAGGSPRNRRIEADVRLQPGLYRVLTRGEGNGGFYNWRANPPEDPRTWGLTLFARSGTVRPFTLWEGHTPLIRLRGDQPDTEKAARFRVKQEATVAVYGMGEFASDADDYGWLDNDASGERLWEQRRENTEHAGGADKNRESQKVLTLAPGVYSLHYRTDANHQLGEFNSDAPDHEERYGAALFLLGPVGAVEVLPATASDALPEPAAVTDSAFAPPAPPAPPSLVAVTRDGVPAPPAAEGALAALVRMESNERRTARFVLHGAQSVRIYATGEFSGSSDLDTAWITDVRGETVWRMADARLRHAGGADRNRYCDETVQLAGGTYVVHYTTDGSHAYNDFDEDPPAFPEAWGVIVARADGPDGRR